jgi:molybdopterin molybdotransferase
MSARPATISIAEHPTESVLDSAASYLAAILTVIAPLPPRRLSLDDADGAVLAEDVRTRCPLPSFDNSAMDGYAVLAADVAAAAPGAPVILPVRNEIAAGDTRPRQLRAGTCMSIMTGALMPAGADAVVRVEWTDGGTEHVAISRPVSAGASVRRRGSNARPGQLLLAAGTRLGPAQIGLLASAGRGTVLARARPRLTVLSAGNELAEPGEALVPGLTWESNSFMLAAAARQAACVTRRHGIVGDDRGEVLAAVRDALPGTDLLVTSGGISMGGEHDVIKAALRTLGTFSFRRVAMQPGMPQGFGTAGPAATPVLTLPGNPVSAFVSFRLFAVPAVRVLQGLDPGEPRTAQAALTAPLTSPAGRRSFTCGVLDHEAGTVTPAAGRSSHQLTALARCDALIIVPEQVTVLPAGSTVEVLELRP